MKTDRELLEQAAKAAGIELDWDVPVGASPWRISGEGEDCGPAAAWNPLEDDGDALRLAVKMGLQITPGTYIPHQATAYHSGVADATEHVNYLQDMFAATRRAIVRAAAATLEEN